MGLNDGSVSIRYIRMKPRIKEMPIQAWGVRCGFLGSSFDGEGFPGSSRAWTTPGEVGVLGGVDDLNVSAPAPAGITGPGMAPKAFSGSVTLLAVGSLDPNIRPSRLLSSPCHRTSSCL